MIKVHVPRSKVIRGQVVRWVQNVKFNSFEKLKYNQNQTWFIDTIWIHLYVYVVKDHIPRSNVIRGQVVRWVQNVKFTSFKKLKSNQNQTWFIDTIWIHLYVYVVKDHIPRSNVIRGQVVRWIQNVKFTSFKKLQNQTWFIDVMMELSSHPHEVKGQLNIKSHVRSICKIALKCKIDSFSYLKPVRTVWPHRVWDQGQVSICIIHKPRRQAPLAVLGQQSIIWYEFRYYLNGYDVIYDIWYHIISFFFPELLLPR